MGDEVVLEWNWRWNQSSPCTEIASDLRLQRAIFDIWQHHLILKFTKLNHIPRHVQVVYNWLILPIIEGEKCKSKSVEIIKAILKATSYKI